MRVFTRALNTSRQHWHACIFEAEAGHIVAPGIISPVLAGVTATRASGTSGIYLPSAPRPKLSSLHGLVFTLAPAYSSETPPSYTRAKSSSTTRSGAGSSRWCLRRRTRQRSRCRCCTVRPSVRCSHCLVLCQPHRGISRFNVQRDIPLLQGLLILC